MTPFLTSSERLSGYSLDKRHSTNRHRKRVRVIAGATKYTYCAAKCLVEFTSAKRGTVSTLFVHSITPDGSSASSTRRRQEGYVKGTEKSSEAEKYYSRPIYGGITRVSFYKTMIESSDMERSGYVDRDQLMLRF